MAEYAPYIFTSTGGASYTPGFDFISTDHVEVYVDDVLQVIDTDYTWNAAFTIVTTTPAVPIGEVIRIQRVTPRIEPYIDWLTESVTAPKLDASAKQGLFALNELRYFLEDTARAAWVPQHFNTPADQINMWPGSSSTVVAINALSGIVDAAWDGVRTYEVTLYVQGGVDLRAAYLKGGPLGTVSDPTLAVGYMSLNAYPGAVTRECWIANYIWTPDAGDIIVCGVTFDADTGFDKVYGTSGGAGESYISIRRLS